ncbi:MAG: phosphoribosylaminoimidazolesuccinocarboxamide synthase [bacterium]
MQKGEKLYEGKAKIIYKTDDSDLVWVEYKDSATAFNGLKKGTIQDKGIYNAKISAAIFEYLEKIGVPTHQHSVINDRELVVKKVEIIPIEVVVRNKVAGSLAKRVGQPEGTELACPILEFCYKDDDLGDPMVNEYHIAAMKWATYAEMAAIKELSAKVNAALTKFFAETGTDLIDFKLEFGRYHGQVILADEISPDTCRLWDQKTGEKLDKDRFRRDLGNVEEAYQEILKRISQ